MPALRLRPARAPRRAFTLIELLVVIAIIGILIGLLLAGDGRAYDGRIGSDGHFAIPGVPAGQARVAVTSLAAGAEGRAAGGHAPAAAPPRRADRAANPASRIPPRYGDLGQSGLTVTVERDTRLDLDLR